MMATAPATLAGIRDLIMPGLWATTARAGRRVISADLELSYVTDEIHLVVSHRLCTRAEIENRMFSLIGDRMVEALLVPKPTSKDLRVERRRLRWRGKQSADTKPRRRP